MGVKLRTNLICEGKNAPAGLKCCVFNDNNAEGTEISLDSPGILRVLSGELCVLGSISQSSHRIEVLHQLAYVQCRDIPDRYRIGAVQTESILTS